MSRHSLRRYRIAKANMIATAAADSSIAPTAARHDKGSFSSLRLIPRRGAHDTLPLFQHL